MNELIEIMRYGFGAAVAGYVWMYGMMVLAQGMAALNILLVGWRVGRQ